MAEELKACPFCGGKAEAVQFTRKRWTVECFADGCGAGIISHGDMQAAISTWNTRAQLPSQGGEAVEVFTTWHPDSRSYEEQIVSHDTKGSRKALGAMNAKLRAKVGRLERELAALSANQSEQVREVGHDGWRQAVDNVSAYAHLYNSGFGIIHEIHAEYARLLAAAPSAGSQKEQGE